MTHAVLTGDVHIGKTTVCQAVVDLARQRRYCVRGILTLPILDKKGQRLGLDVLDLSDGKQRKLARVGQDFGGPSVGPYHFDPAALQWGGDVIARAIAVGCDLLVVDEIGRLELEQNTGFSQVLELLATNVVPRSLLVVRTVLLDAFRRRLPGLEYITFEVTVDNRDVIPAEIAQGLFFNSC